MIHFNTEEGGKERARTKPLTLAQEERVIKILNDRFFGRYSGVRFSKTDEKLVQRFINHYQNLSHHMHSTCGLWATDKKEIAEQLTDFFEIKF